jgi:Ulp1 family protease
LGGDCVIAGPLIYYYLSNMSKKFNSNFEFTEWKWEKSTRMPKQTNGYDCGVFMLQCLYQITSNKDLSFTQNDIPKLRIHKMHEILSYNTIDPILDFNIDDYDHLL